MKRFDIIFGKVYKNPIPDESTLRKLYVDDIYNETIENNLEHLSVY